MTRRLRNAAVLCLSTLGLTACQSASPSEIEDFRARGYAELEVGHLDAAAALADRGHRAAVAAGDRARAWAMEVLRAEVLFMRRDAAGALLVLAGPPPSGVPAAVTARALMTHGASLCQLTAHDETRAGDSADGFLDQAAAIAQQERSPRLTVDIALRRGFCELERRDAASAEARFREALAVAREARLSHGEALAAGSLGLVRLRAGRYDDAADWFQRSLALSAGDAVDLKNLGNLGWCYTMLGDTEKALELLGRTVDLATRRGFTEDLEVAVFHQGEVHVQLRDFAAARRSFERALSLARKLDHKDNQIEILGLLQSVALQAGDTAGAAAYAHQAAPIAKAVSPDRVTASLLIEAQLEAERRHFDEARALYEKVARAGESPDGRWRARAGVATLEVAAGNPQAADRAFRQALDDVEAMRRALKQETFDFLLFSSMNDLYGRYAAFLVDQGRPAEALAVVDRNRARVLTERMGAPDAPDPAAPERFEAAATRARGVLLAYWLGERSFLWVVTPTSTEVHELPPAAALRDRVDRYQDLILRSRDPIEAGAQDSTALFQILVGPAVPRIPRGGRVVIVPDGALHQLSFDTLVVPDPTPHYWVEDVVTMRAPSLAILTATRSVSSPPEHALLAIGDPDQPSPEFPDLPNASREMTDVAGQFPPGQALVLGRSDATPQAYRAADPDRFRYIHFAAHATSHTEQPLESAVVLSRKDEGFKLFAHEILDVPIRADVVTLSACRGAGARTYRGEGLVGFAWAFLRAGARHVIAGLWNVEDASTARLMRGFYARLAAGTPPPEALRDARLELLRSSGAYRKPFYWGPFAIYVQQPAQ